MARYTSSTRGLQSTPLSNDRRFLKLIEGLEATITSLDETKCHVIQELMSEDWLTMSNKVVKKMEHFLSELLVVRPIFCHTVIRELINKFVAHAAINLETHQLEDEISSRENKVFSIIHRNLQKILESFPIFEEYAVKTMSSLFPYMTKGAHIHYCYITNLLTCSGYMPKSKMEILHIIIHRVAKIDVNIPRQDIEDLTEHLQASQVLLTRKKKLKNEGLVTVKLESVKNDFVPNPLIETLDICLQPIFEFVRADVQSLQRDDLKGIDNTELFSYLAGLRCIFDKELLPSFGVNHVQFLFFYLLSQQSEFVQIFLDTLWKKVDSTGTSAVLRIQSMSYIAGYLSRAKYVSLKMVKRWLTKLSDWANEYVNNRAYGCHWASINLQAHGCFYAVCQTIFYVVAFRNKELVESRNGSAYLRTLNLGRLITSDLNPLKASSKAITNSFVEASNQNQTTYCRTILERNHRSGIRTMHCELDDVGNQTFQLASSTLQSFFPCEPYLLPRTRSWIDHIYLSYDPYLQDMKIEKEEPLEDFPDSAEMELGCSFNSDSPLMTRLKSSYNLDSSLDFMDC